MQNSLQAASAAPLRPTCGTNCPTLAQCVIPVAPTCFLLQPGSETDIGALTNYLHVVANTCHTFGARNLTFIVSDEWALQLAGFFDAANQRKLIGDLPIEIRFLFASNDGAFVWGSSELTAHYLAKYFVKHSVSPEAC
ncbi:hypothetical protein D9M09_24515 [Janthinobacterium agaricidamnosum]|uniref:Uncharacterized protein n=1 Tax=Janthinobacterium agaricidamnosum TaxID=55508 RepID=A0A3G2EGI2_9BURK|nr:hypothetical protein [Janthinobacterium agaricidamnosum]AYM78609.1 hypothetical protein D9M09_24515 [Janthinobacterium agaricidamnosum]